MFISVIFLTAETEDKSNAHKRRKQWGTDRVDNAATIKDK